MAPDLERKVTSNQRDGNECLRSHPIIGALFFLIAIAAILGLRLPISRSSLLIKNLLFTQITAAALWALIVWVIPQWARQLNRYLWTETRLGVSVQRSIAIAAVAYFLGIVVVALVLVIGQTRHPELTLHWPALWGIFIASAVWPAALGVIVSLEMSGVTNFLSWLEFSRFLTFKAPGGRKDFTDAGRILMIICGTVSAASIQIEREHPGQ